MKPIAARTPLHDVPADEAVYALPLCGKLNLRGQGEAFFTACEQALGVALPTVTNTSDEHGDTRVFWMGPDEWLVHLPLSETAGVSDMLRNALKDHHSAVTDVSDYYTVLALDTPLATELIACGSAFDTREFGGQHCAQIRFAHASVLIWTVSNAHADGITSPAYRVQVRWSYARYLLNYFQQSHARLSALHVFSA